MSTKNEKKNNIEHYKRSHSGYFSNAWEFFTAYNLLKDHHPFLTPRKYCLCISFELSLKAILEAAEQSKEKHNSHCIKSLKEDVDKIIRSDEIYKLADSSVLDLATEVIIWGKYPWPIGNQDRNSKLGDFFLDDVKKIVNTNKFLPLADGGIEELYKITEHYIQLARKYDDQHKKELIDSYLNKQAEKLVNVIC